MLRLFFRVIAVLTLLMFAVPTVSYAQMTSPNYSVDEMFIGTGGELDACSSNYCSRQSSGGTGGDASSTNYGIMAGFGSPDEPALSVAISNNSIDLGLLSASSTAAASASVAVSNYLSNGYVVKVYGEPPKNHTGAGSKVLAPLTTPTQSSPGSEQFGINMVANDTPGIGVNPVQVPDGSFSFGMASAGYDQKDYFKYVEGDVVAESNRETGQTNYTMSVIANVSSITAGGRYTTLLTVQVIASF